MKFLEGVKKDSNDLICTKRAHNKEIVLRKSRDELKSDLEVLRTLNQETHYRIRVLEEEYEKSQANESNKEESEEDYLQN